MALTPKTIQRLKANPHYKPSSSQLVADGPIDKKKDEEEVKTFGVIPVQPTGEIQKHPTQPKVRKHKRRK